MSSKVVKSKNENGTGYAGDAATDRKRLLDGRKKAAVVERKRDTELTKYLSGVQKSLLKLGSDGREFSNSEEATKLCGSMKEIFRNQVPADWGSRKKLYDAALTCCKIMTSNTELSKLFGDVEDSESLLAALEQFAQHAEMLRSHEQQGEAKDLKLGATVLEIRNLAEQAYRDAKPVPGSMELMSVMDQTEHYRKAMGPLRFDLVSALKSHSFAKNQYSGKVDTRRLFKELTAYKTSLPVEHGSSIFVRAIEDRLDLLRVLITGPEDSPYANGCFLFDIHLPAAYPSQPPLVKFLTTGGGRVRFNPNLYNCGKVCLSLLGTWAGPGWVSGESTLLQVLVSIQSLILVPDPYFNEPGYQSTQGTPHGEQQSANYNKKIRNEALTHCISKFLKDAVAQQLTDYPEFADVMVKHFREKKSVLEKQVNKWVELDSSLSNLSNQVLRDLQALVQMQKGNSKRAAVPRARQVSSMPIFCETDGIVEILDDDDPRAKKRTALRSIHDNDVIELDDEDDVNLPAKVNFVGAAASGGMHDVIELD